MKVCLVINRRESRERLRGILPEGSDIHVVRFGEPLAGRRFDLILLTEWVDLDNSQFARERIYRWSKEDLPLSLSRNGEIVRI